MTRSKPTYTTVASALTPAKIILGWFALSLCSATAFAQDEGSDQDAYIANLRACQAITDPTLRLTCYDQAVGEVVTASDEGDVRIVDREDVKKTRRNLFGFSLPDLGIFGGDDDEEEELFESTITSVSLSGRNTLIITIEDGNAVWRVSSASRNTIRTTRVGDTIVFKKAALGSYFLRINGRTGVKGRRIR